RLSGATWQGRDGPAGPVRGLVRDLPSSPPPTDESQAAPLPPGPPTPPSPKSRAPRESRTETPPVPLGFPAPRPRTPPPPPPALPVVPQGASTAGADLKPLVAAGEAPSPPDKTTALAPATLARAPNLPGLLVALRRRWLLALALGLPCAVAAAAAGWFLIPTAK